MPTIVYDLWHTYEKPFQEDDEEKHIGTYSSRENAQRAIERLKKQPGFRRFPDAFQIFEVVLDQDGWTEGFVIVNPHYAIIYKIAPRAEWEVESGDYHGSAHDKADGFLRFSTFAQLPETLRRYYAGQDGLMLVAVEAEKLGAALKWEHAPSRDEDFPHLYAPLPRATVLWAAPINRTPDGEFLLPPETL